MSLRFLLTAVLIGLLATFAAAQSSSNSGRDPGKAPTGAPEKKAGQKQREIRAAGLDRLRSRRFKELPAFTPEREAAGLTFVTLHHPELVDLLTQLKATNPEQYEQAVRELFLTSEKLVEVKEKNPDRYLLELEQWKNRSRIQLLAARLAVSPKPELKNDLRRALESQQRLRIELIELERRLLLERAERLQTTAEGLRAQQPEHVENQLQRLLKIAEANHPMKARAGTSRRNTTAK